MLSKTDNVANGILNPAEPINTKLLLSDEEVYKNDVSGSVMDGPIMDTNSEGYTVYKERWLMLTFFVVYSASNSLQWTQYTIISDIITKYYGVSSNAVSWTSMIYMVTYVPLIFPASWLLDKTVSYK
ncbi:jg10989 [Pararge aegeria aegeria]|uniref:Jg10989 protein n=1 Tax=Pararge aegeria aegeria TaxID=348720 RepID=A0A8S4SDC8_9NEOP|nr:jg10989 [Pararge aegeria aegeria]